MGERTESTVASRTPDLASKEFAWHCRLTRQLPRSQIALQVLGFVRKIANSDCQHRHVCLSVSPPAGNISAPTGRIFIKIYI